MKFTADKSILLKCLERCKSVTDSKSPMPILSHVLLETDEDKLHGCLNLSATDLFVSIRTDMSVSDVENGSITLNAKELYDRLKAMPDGDAKFSLNGTAVTIKSAVSKRKFVMQGLPAADYPTLADPDQAKPDEPKVGFAALDLAEAIQATVHSVSLDETRLHLNSLLIELEGDSARFVSTDGHRLSKLTKAPSSPVSVPGKMSWLIPLKAVREIGKLCAECATNKNADQDVRLAQSGSNLFVKVNEFVFGAKLADCQFVPYDQIIPNSYQYTVKIDRKSLISSVKAIALSSGESRGVKFNFNEGKLNLSAQAGGGEAEDELDCNYDGKEVVFGFSSQYMVECLNAINTDNVVFKLNNELDPAVVVPDNDKDDYLAIVMPMRTN